LQKRRLILGWVTAGVLSIVAAGACAQEKGGMDEWGAYQPVPNWLKPVRDGYVERGVSVFAESADRIFFTSDIEVKPTRGAGGPGGAGGNQRSGGRPAAENLSNEHHWVMVLDRNGNVIEEWKQWDSLFKMPHAVRISPYDPEKSVWVIERENQQIFKFSHDGKKLLMTLGEKGVMGQDERHFGRPTDIAFAPDGSFYISDGYANTRILKFDRNGKFLFQWGSDGTGPGQFKVDVHDVAIDKQGKVYVADRGNNRIQVFDANGKYLDQWPNVMNPSYIYITKDGYVWVVSQRNRIAKYTMNGKLLTVFGTYGTLPGDLDDPHDMSVDPEGNLYVALFSLQRSGLEKFTPLAGADRSRLVTSGLNR
jgi:peptidylamidoglycolate lyase